MARSKRRNNRSSAPKKVPSPPPVASPPVEPTPEPITTPVASAADVVVERLDEMMSRFSTLEASLASLTELATQPPAVPTPAEHEPQASASEDELWQLRDDVAELRSVNEDLVQQNQDLAAKLAQGQIDATVQNQPGGDESMSWEDRKAAMMRQLEDDTFDANAFIESLPGQINAAGDDDSLGTPVEFVQSLLDRLEVAEANASKRQEQIAELEMLLQQQHDDRGQQADDGSLVMGAAAIAGLVDSDELVQQERERLQELKAHWEDKFRQTEIAASLERAQLSRERQDLARRAAELEEKMDELKRQQRSADDPAPTGRRWLAELGLGSQS